MEMRCLRSMCGISIRDRVRNEEVRKKVQVNEKLSERIDKRVLTWFGHVERMNDGRMTKRVYKSEVSGTRLRGRPRLRWKDGVKRTMQSMNVSMKDAYELVHERDQWRMLVRGCNQNNL